MQDQKFHLLLLIVLSQPPLPVGIVAKSIHVLSNYENGNISFMVIKIKSTVMLQREWNKQIKMTTVMTIIQSYTTLCLRFGLIQKYHNGAIKMGDGKRIMCVIFYMYYNTCWCYKYASGILKTLTQSTVILSRRYLTSWSGMELWTAEESLTQITQILFDLEHCNKIFKDEAHSYSGTFTDKTLSWGIRSALTTPEMGQSKALLTIDEWRS